MHMPFSDCLSELVLSQGA